MSRVLLAALIVSWGLAASIATSDLRLELRESEPVGAVLGRLGSLIRPPPPPGVTFSLMENPYFSVEPTTGVIRVVAPLDRDSDRRLCSEPGFPASCIFAGLVMTSERDYHSVQFVVRDVNDNAPGWLESQVQLEISEASPPRHTTDLPTASDPDWAENGIMRYRLVGRSDLFRLLERKLDDGRLVPRLQLLRPLDREHTAVHNLTLEVEDGAKPFHTGSLQVRVHVADENDNAPHFDAGHYAAVLPEDFEVGATVPLRPTSALGAAPDSGRLAAGLQARDPDEGANGQVDYAFAVATAASVRETFALDGQSGQLRLVGQLSFDRGPTNWTFSVVARDRGRPPLSATTQVTIQLLDTNNHAPTIQVSLAEGGAEALHVLENAAATDERVLASVTVSDRDSGPGGNFECHLRDSYASGASANFRLELRGRVDRIAVYSLINQATYDRELQAEFRLSIFCTDDGQMPQNAVETIRVLVDDVNDNAPRFDQKRYLIRVDEEEPIGSLLRRIEAVDPDAGPNGQLRYQLRDLPSGKAVGPISQLLTVNAEGEIRVKKRLDRESIPTGFEFELVARDLGEPALSASTTVSVELLDVNDCIPRFGQERYEFQVTEDFDRNFTGLRNIGRLNASDCDQGVNAQIRFRIAEQSPFEIKADGSLVSERLLDREVQAAYSLTVLAMDGPDEAEQWVARRHGPHWRRHTAAVSVHIQILDLNDHKPHFVSPNSSSSNKYQVSFRQEELFPVAKLVAKDADDGKNGRLAYSIEKGNQAGLFRLLPGSGDLVVNRPMKEEHQGPVFLTVKAQDHGYPRRSALVEVTVLVDDSMPVKFDKYSMDQYLNDQLPSLGVLGPGEHRLLGMEINKFIMVCIVAASCLICVVLFAGLLLFARRCRQPKPAQQQTPASAAPPMVAEEPDIKQTMPVQFQPASTSLHDLIQTQCGTYKRLVRHQGDFEGGASPDATTATLNLSSLSSTSPTPIVYSIAQAGAGLYQIVPQMDLELIDQVAIT